jgi:hypothetical protein
MLAFGNDRDKELDHWVSVGREFGGVLAAVNLVHNIRATGAFRWRASPPLAVSPGPR